MITLSFELPRFNRQMAEIATLCGLSNAQVVTRTARLWLRDCIAATPPTGKGAGATKLGTQLKLGMQRIKLDITSRGFPLVKTITKNSMTREKRRSVLAGVQRITDKGLYEKATELLHKRGYKTSGIIREPRKSLHNRIRWRGRVKKGVAPYYVGNQSARDTFLKEVQARLGRGKAGWNLAASRLRIDLPQWITRHNTGGHFKGIQDVQKPVIEFGNRAHHVQNYEWKIMKNTAKFREIAMAKELVHFWRAAKNSSLDKLRARFAAGRKDVFVAMN